MNLRGVDVAPRSFPVLRVVAACGAARINHKEKVRT